MALDETGAHLRGHEDDQPEPRSQHLRSSSQISGAEASGKHQLGRFRLPTQACLGIHGPGELSRVQPGLDCISLAVMGLPATAYLVASPDSRGRSCEHELCHVKAEDNELGTDIGSIVVWQEVSVRQREPSANRAYSVATEANESDCCNGTRVLETKTKVYESHPIISSPHKPSGLSLINRWITARRKAKHMVLIRAAMGVPHGTS